MKVAFITSCSFPPSEGLATHILSLSHFLKERGHEITIFVRRKGVGLPETVVYSGIDFVLVPSTSYPAISSLVFSWRLKKFFDLDQFDIIHYHSPLVATLHRHAREGQRVLTTFHSTMKADTKYIEPINLHAILNKIMGAMISPTFEKQLLCASHKIIAVSDEVKAELTDLYHVPPERISVVINGINHDHFRDSGAGRRRQILYLGRLGYRKGLRELLEAVGQFVKEGGQHRFVFVGDGPLAGHLTKFIATEVPAGTVEWLGNVPETLIPDLLAQSEFLIMPSLYETGPRVVLEAMAAKTPVVATQVGLLNIFDDADFIRIERTDPAAILRALNEAVNLSQAAYQVLQERSLQVSMRFSSEVTYRKIENDYQ